MARLSQEEIERLKLAGQAKREARARKRAKVTPKVTPTDILPAGLGDRLRKMVFDLERAYYKPNPLTPEMIAEIKDLLLPAASEEIRFKAYQRFLHEYEGIVFYAWKTELHDLVFSYWDEMLSNPNSVFTGNSIIRLMGEHPTEHLLEIITRHKEKFASDALWQVLKDAVERNTKISGPFNARTHSFETWTEEEKELWQEIAKLFD